MHKIRLLRTGSDEGAGLTSSPVDFEMEHAFRMKITWQSVQHPLMANIVFVLKRHGHLCTGCHIPLVLVVGERRAVELPRVPRSRTHGDGLLTGDSAAVARQLIIVFVHHHAIHVNLLPVMRARRRMMFMVCMTQISRS